jgi:hypothetical protein
VLTTQPPIVVVARPRPRYAGSAIVLRGTLQDDPVLTTPPPLVVTQPARPRVATVQLFRSSTEDVTVPAVATPQPIAVTYVPKPRPGVAVVLRGSLFDATTPGPIVVAAPGRRPGAVILLERGTLADDLVLITPGPFVVVAQRPRSAGRAVLVRSPLEGVEPTDCKAHRPNTGTVARGSVGTVTRPFTGVVEFCTCCT